MPFSFAIYGAGKVGRTLARLLAEAGCTFLGAASRTLASAQAAVAFAGAGRAVADPAEVTRGADLVLITTPDAAIGDACRALAGAGGVMKGGVVAHCSGALPSSILEPARAAGAHVGSLHPLQTFATPERACEALAGATACIEGDPEAVELLQRVADLLRLRPVTIATERKPLYHAAACMASGYFVAVEAAAARMAEAAGVPEGEGLELLMPVIRATAENLGAVGIPRCLTGPIARGDVPTVRAQLEAIETWLPEALPLWRALGLHAVDLAVGKRTCSTEAAAELRRLLA